MDEPCQAAISKWKSKSHFIVRNFPYFRQLLQFFNSYGIEYVLCGYGLKCNAANRIGDAILVKKWLN